MDQQGRSPPPQHEDVQRGPQGFMRPQSSGGEYRGCGKLNGRTAVITGGDLGIGCAVAIAFAKEGVDCVLFSGDEHGGAADTKRRVEALGRRCVTLSGDVGAEPCRRTTPGGTPLRDRSSATRTRVPGQSVRRRRSDARSPALPGTGERDHQHDLGHGLQRQATPHRFLSHPRCLRGLHALAFTGTLRARDPRQRRGAGADLDIAHQLDHERRGRVPFRSGDPQLNTPASRPKSRPHMSCSPRGMRPL